MWNVYISCFLFETLCSEFYHRPIKGSRGWRQNIYIIKNIVRRVHKTAKSDCYLRHVYPSVPLKRLGFNCMGCHKILYLRSFPKYVEKIQVSLKSHKNKGYVTWSPKYVADHISLSKWNKNVSNKNYRENHNTYFTFNNFFPESCVLYEIMWKNIVESGRSQMTI